MRSVNVAFCSLLILCSTVVLVTSNKNTPTAKKENSSIKSAFPHIKQSKGLDVTLKCTISSNNATGIIWTRDGSKVKNDSRHTAVVKSNQKFRFAFLKIQSIESSDYGTYKCHANVSGKVSSASISLTEKKTLPPPIKSEDNIPKTRIKVSLKSTVFLTCHLNASASSIKWLKNGTEVKIDKRHVISPTSDETILEIKSVEAGDFGIYECTSNISGKFQSTSIELGEKKQTHLVMKATRNELEVPLKGNVTLRCDFSTSLLSDSYSWRKGNTEVYSDERHIITNYSRGNTTTVTSLDIRTLEKGDYGVYKCQANVSNQTLSTEIKLVEKKS